jgi:hypothetical protein
VRDDVVDDRGGHYATGRPAFSALTEGMQAKKVLASLAPLPRVPARVRVRPLRIGAATGASKMRGTKTVLRAHERAAPRMPTWAQRMRGHCVSFTSPAWDLRLASCRSSTTCR